MVKKISQVHTSIPVVSKMYSKLFVFAQTNVFVMSAVLNVPVKCSMVHRFLVFVAQNENVSPIRKSPMPQVMSNATTEHFWTSPRGVLVTGVLLRA